MLIFRCFTPTLWIVVWSTVVLVSLCYLALAQLIAACRPATTAMRHVKENPHHTYQQQERPQQDRTGLVGQIVGALLNAPTNGLHRTTAHQKLFVAFGLIWGLTITGAFQGSLVDVYTTPTSMKNLDTLAELDASGLKITVTAPALIVDVFGTERPGSTIGNLRQRIVIEHVPTRMSAYSVLAGTTAGLIRNQDFVRLSTKYLGDDGTARLHRLRECLRSYTLAYIYPRGSPLYRAANGHILHFLQHGLYVKWQRDAAHLLATNRALKIHARTIRSGRPEHGEQMTLRLDHLLLPFMLLGTGVTLGAGKERNYAVVKIYEPAPIRSVPCPDADAIHPTGRSLRARYARNVLIDIRLLELLSNDELSHEILSNLSQPLRPSPVGSV
uniref:Ionotropic glutamate receptor C-terminal domain-containing protein n=1 Tax=Anopheles culicifacies TaxID=139723 RepID=A0A182MLD6_9DIPT